MSLLRRLPLPIRRRAIDALLGGIAAARRPGWAIARPGDAAAPGDVMVSGFLNEVSGVGRAARMTADALERAGVRVVRHDLRPMFADLLRGGLELPGRRNGGVWIVHANAPEGEAALAAHRPADWARRRRIAYWAWETPLAPASWARVAPFFHEIWTPSRFTHDAVAERLRGSGRPELVERLRVVPHPAPTPFAGRPDATAWTASEGAFRALVLFDARSAADRKNPWGAVEAWTRAFPQPSADAVLLLKAVGLDLDPRVRGRLDAILAARSDVRVLDTELDDHGVRALVAACDVLLSTHRAEGFGLVLAEAMACGRAVVATGWSGNTDFMDERCSVLLPYRLVPVVDASAAYRGSVWAEPAVDAAAAALRRLRADPEERARLGAAAAVRVRDLDRAWTPDSLLSLGIA